MKHKIFLFIFSIMLISFSLLIYHYALADNITATSTKTINTKLSIRALMIHPRSRKLMDFYKEQITLAAQNHYNIISIESTGWVHYPNLPAINLPNGFYPEDLQELSNYANSLGIEVIPSIWLLTHQNEVAQRYQPDLLLNNVTINVHNPKTWEFEKKLIDDTITIYHPKKMIIGHDELWGYGNTEEVKQALQSGVKRITPQDYVSHIIKVHDYLKSKGIQTIIWGDMFLTPDYSLGIYPADRSKPAPGYNGTSDFIVLLDTLPKDIIIIDWHYENKSELYPSYDFFQSKGFTVWGASWHESHNIKSFTDYVHARAKANEGMIATTWQFSSDIKYKNYVTRIIKESGEIFYGK